MKKGQRPSKHYRRIKTKKGRKKVLINKNVNKKVRRARFGVYHKKGYGSTTVVEAKRLTDKDIVRVPSPWEISDLNKKREQEGKPLLLYEDVLAEMKRKRDEQDLKIKKDEERASRFSSPFEIERSLKQQNDMNLVNNIKEAKELARKIPKAQERYSSGVRAYNKLNELESLQDSLERKRKLETKFDLFQEKDVGRKLIEANMLARDSQDPKLIEVNKAYKKIFETNWEARRQMQDPEAFDKQKTYAEKIKDLNKESKKIIREMDPTKIEIPSRNEVDKMKYLERERILRELGKYNKIIAETKGMTFSESKQIADEVGKMRQKLRKLEER